MVYQIIVLLAAAWLVGQSMLAAARMHRGDKLLRMAGHLAAGAVGIWLAHSVEHAGPWHAATAAGMALASWLLSTLTKGTPHA